MMAKKKRPTPKAARRKKVQGTIEQMRKECLRILENELGMSVVATGAARKETTRLATAVDHSTITDQRAHGNAQSPSGNTASAWSSSER